MSLEVIRSKLDPMYSDHYKDIHTFINDVRLIFRNVYLFYRVSIALSLFEKEIFQNFPFSFGFTGRLQSVRQHTIFG